MARSTPRVDGSVLVGAATANRIAVGSPAWYTWLEDAASFAFTSTQGSFTARKERRGISGWYWKAYRKRGGILYRAYLGKSADLTPERLTAIAIDLGGRATGPALESAGVLGPSIVIADGELPHLTGAQLPEGTLTFCFTDIEGSTQLWEQHPQTMPAALARHEAILREAIQAHRGVVFKAVSDGVQAVFSTAPDALSAALSSQRALSAEPWGPIGPLHVRIALHTGVAAARDGDYYGAPLNRVARILAAGHGRQILLSLATEELVRDHLPPGTTLRDLGNHQLKDLRHAEQIFQLVSADLPADFPPVRTLSSSPAPIQPLQLLDTKLYVPPARSQLVPRPRLLARLDTGLAGKLTLLSAPAGFGKTTLLSAWRATTAGSAVPFAWVSLDAADSDPLRFWSYVIAALDMLQPDSGATALVLLQSPQPPPIEAVLTPLLNALSTLTSDAVLVLDDYHLIDAPPIHTALGFLLDHFPPRLHLVITTRADPPLPLTRLRARGQITELRAADLCFTTDETVDFLTRLMGLPLSADDIAALEARTEGWIAGLQFAALAMRDRSDLTGFIRAFTGSHRFVVDYLAEEVLARQPPHLQAFLTQTAMLDRMCGSLCDAVLGITMNDEHGTMNSTTPKRDSSFITHHSSFGDSYSQLILGQLERANLFLVPLDDERHWYRYHHLFAEVLRERLTRGVTSAAVATLHRRASAWFEGQRLVSEAIQHALAARDWEHAADLVEQHGRPIALGGQVTTVLAWIDAIPNADIVARPRLAAFHAALLIYTNQADAAEARLQNAEQWAQAAPPNDLTRLVLGQVATLRSTQVRFAGDLQRSIAFAHQALDLLPEPEVIGRSGAMVNAAHAFLVHGDVTPAIEHAVQAVARPARASGNLFATLRGYTLVARLYVLQGRLTEAFARYQQAVQAIPNQEAGLPALVGGADYYAGLGDLLRERNELDRAERLLRQFIGLLPGIFAVEAESVTVTYLALARIQQARGDATGALATIAEFFDHCRQRRFFVGLVLRGAAIQARLWLAQGLLDAAVGWAASCGLAPTDAGSYLQEPEYLTLARVRSAQRRHDPTHALDAILAMLDGLLAAAERAARMHSVIEIVAVRALVWQAQGDSRAALRDLERALALAAPEGYVRVFVDEGQPMELLLAQIAEGASAVAGYAAALLAAFPQTMKDERGTMNEDPPAHRSAFILQPLVEPLSAREHEILRLIADGHSNQAIADRLVVAVSTVKKHVNNLYGKLGVQSRTQALARARELNLL